MTETSLLRYFMVLDFVTGLTNLSSVCIFIKSIITNYIITFAYFDDKKELAEALGLSRPAGAIVTDVAPESPAAQAGLEKGDVVVGINGRVIRDFNRLRLFVAVAKPGANLALIVNRHGEEKLLRATLSERPTATVEPDSSRPQTSGDTLAGAVVAELTGRSRLELGIRAELAGVVILGVDPNGAAAEAGLQPGDLIVAATRRPVGDLAAWLATLTGSGAVVLEVNRNGGTLFFAVPRA